MTLMTKAELKKQLKEGKTFDELFHFSRGQECLIFKADHFQPGNSILYIPDIDLNEMPVDDVLTNAEERINDAVSLCYTGDDFIQQCEGNDQIAERLFNFCDWQHPSSALDDFWDDLDSKDDRGNSGPSAIGPQKFKVTITETLKRVVEVVAEDSFEAEQKVTDGWHNGEYILEAEDFVDVDFDASAVTEK